MTELMATGRDCSFMIRNTSFTKQVNFYICKIQIKPKLYPLYVTLYPCERSRKNCLVIIVLLSYKNRLNLTKENKKQDALSDISLTG